MSCEACSLGIVHVFFFPSHQSPKHIRRKAGRLTCIVLRECEEEGGKKEQREQGIRSREQMIEIS